MKSLKFSFVILLVVLLWSCGNEATDKIYSISGTVQKGPFVNGSEVMVYELNSSYAQTGRTFHTTLNSQGKFTLADISLVSPYVELVASGFYYNEVTGKISSAPITLNAMVDLTDKEIINVNVLTNLEYGRIKYLVDSEKKSFEEAKEIANSEVLSLFTFNASSFADPELLDLSEIGDDNAILLAISSILQGNLSAAEMSKCMSDIITDIESDGTLDDVDLKNLLYSQATLLNVEDIENNLKEIYAELGIELTEINNFEEKISEYITNTHAEFVSPFVFPDTTSYGINLLKTQQTKFQVNTTYVFAVDVPSSGSITIKLNQFVKQGYYYLKKTYMHGFELVPNGVYSFTITSSVNGELIEYPIYFEGYGEATMEIYYNDESEPTTTKTISWGGYEDRDDYGFPAGEPYGVNLLALCDSSVIVSDTTYLLSVWPLDNQAFTYNFTLELPDNTTVTVVDGWANQAYSVDGNKFFVTLNNDKKSGPDIIMFKFNGEGVIHLSSDFLYNSGESLTRTFTLIK